MINKTAKELLIAGIHAYGVNMFCGGKYHDKEFKTSEAKAFFSAQEKHFGDAADRLMKNIIEIIEKDLVVRVKEDSCQHDQKSLGG